MALPTAKSYSAESGSSIWGGRPAPSTPLAWPEWRQGLTPLQAAQISGTRFYDSPDWDGWVAPGGNRRGLFAYSGGALDPVRSRLWRVGGGHVDYGGNDPWMLDLLTDPPTWRQRRAPTATIAEDVAYYSDGRPTSRHTYWHVQYSTQLDRLMLAAASAAWGSGNTGFTSMDGFNPATNDYDPQGTYSGTLSSLYGSPCWQDEHGNIYTHNPSSGEIRKWNSPDNTASGVRTGNTPVYETAYCYDPTRKIAVRFFNGGAPSGYFDHSQSNLPFVETAVGGGAAAVFEPGGTGNHRYSITYDSDLDCFWAVKRYDGTKLYKITVSGAGPYTMSAQAYDLGAGIGDWYAQGGDAANTYGAFAYVPALRGIVWSYWADSLTVFIPTA